MLYLYMPVRQISVVRILDREPNIDDLRLDELEELEEGNKDPGKTIAMIPISKHVYIYIYICIHIYIHIYISGSQKKTYTTKTIMTVVRGLRPT